MEDTGATFRGGELIDYPGWYKIDGSTEDGAKSWSAVRKPDGTWWWVAVTHLFPPGGGTLNLELGDQITEPKTLAQCNEQYADLLQKLHEKRMMGDASVGLESYFPA